MFNRILPVLVLLFLAEIVVYGSGETEQKFPGDLSLPDIKDFIKAQGNIIRLQRQECVDWDAVIAQYKLVEPVIKMVDEQYGTKYVMEIPDAIEKCRLGNNPVVNSQITGKGLQHITILAINIELKAMYQGTSMPLYAKRIAAYTEAIRATFVRRDNNFFPVTGEMEKGLDAALHRIFQADKGSFILARRDFDDIVFRNYALCVYYEISEVEKERDSNPELAERHLMEGVMYYRIIKDRIKKKSRKADELISNMLAGTIFTANASVLAENLKQGMGNIPLLYLPVFVNAAL